jgi:iron complex outermembrane recepter protein
MESGHPPPNRQGGLPTLLLALASCFVGTLAFAAGPRSNFNVPAGDARKALLEFFSQSKVELLYDADKLRGMRTNAVAGNLEASEALDIMLHGTGLQYSFDDDFSFVSIAPEETLPQQTGSAEHIEFPTAVTLAKLRAETELRELYGPEPKLEEVVVTGTLIRGVLDIVSPTEFVTKREMKRSAYASVQDALQALPMNFGGGPSEDYSTAGNFARGSSVNLRGLGSNATLVLIDGRRQPYSGVDTDFVDLSNIAWSIVDRVEVLPDGASALYGSDAIAGVVNVVLRKKLDGAETQVRYGNAPGGADERLFAQLFGKTWDTGNMLMGYQYSERTELPSSAREYAANSDKTPLGGSDHRSNRSNPGNFFDPRTQQPLFAIPLGQDGSSLEVPDLLPGEISLQNRYDGVELLPDKRLHSVYLHGTQRLGERWEIFADGRFTDRYIRQDYLSSEQLLTVPSTNAFYVNPIPGAPFAVVGYNFRDDLGMLDLRSSTKTLTTELGVKASVGETWSVKLSGLYGSEILRYEGANQVRQSALRAALADGNPATAFNPFGDGSNTNPATIETIRFTHHIHARSQISAANLVADGTVLELPTGAVKVAVGAEWRKEERLRAIELSPTAHLERKVDSVYTELAVPLVGSLGNPRETPRLELSLAGRYERYSDFGATSDPKIGLRWTPLESLKLRTSWGTSFKAPKLSDIYDPTRDIVNLASLRDPKSPSGSSIVIGLQGSDPNLQEETASTWTAGIDLAPPAIEGLKMSLTYYSIDYDDRIAPPSPASQFDILLQEDDWSEAITRSPSREAVNALCDSPRFRGSVDQCKLSSVSAIIDFRTRNLSKTRVRGLDFKVDHSFQTRYGRWDLGLNGGYVFSFRQASSSSAPLKSVLDTLGNPAALRLRGTLEWNQRGWNLPGFGFALTVDHFGGYRDPSSTLVSQIDPLSTVDLRLGYTTADGSGAFDGMEIGLNAVNVFNTSPPFVDVETGYDSINSDPYGRVISLGVQKHW